MLFVLIGPGSGVRRRPFESRQRRLTSSNGKFMLLLMKLLRWTGDDDEPHNTQY